METALTPSDTAQIDLGRDVVEFFAALRAEQAKFLEAMAQARAALPQSEGHLAQISAMHGRLTRQFFDAQRAILQRRAEADAEVAHIAHETDVHANTVLASALAHSAAASMSPSTPTDATDDSATSALVERTTRSAAVTMSALAARARFDAEVIAKVIDDAFESRETQDARFERQLQIVLDEWWAFEKQESKALIDDARARAAMRLHKAHLEACELMGQVAPLARMAEPMAMPTPLPAPTPSAMPADLPAPPATRDAVRALLDNVKSNDLESVFAELEVLLAPVAHAASANPTVDAPLESDLVASFLAPTGDTFDSFWSAAPVLEPVTASEPVRRSWREVLTRVVMPITAVTALLAAAMAWLG